MIPVIGGGRKFLQFAIEIILQQRFRFLAVEFINNISTPSTLLDAPSLTGLAQADLVVTGEGRLDATSFDGKVVGGVVDLARAAGVPVVAVVGQAAPDVTTDVPVLDLSAELGEGLEPIKDHLYTHFFETRKIMQETAEIDAELENANED